MRFGVVVSAPDRTAYANAVRHAEALAYDVVLCSDHLDLGGRHFSHFAPIPALTFAAAATERVRVGTSVLNQDLRHPAVVAREAASLDVLSGGRLELGLGAGWAQAEYRMAGIPFSDPATRTRRFAEYVQVVKGVMCEPAFSFEGEFFRIEEMPGEPAPLQMPHPPIMIGAIGPRMLRLAAREADIISINLLQTPDPSEQALAERVGWVREAAAARFPEIELQISLAATIPSDRSPADAVRDEIAAGNPFLRMLAGKFDVEALAASPMVLTGSAQEMAEKLAGLHERIGIGAVMAPMPHLEALANVIPRLNGANA